MSQLAMSDKLEKGVTRLRQMGLDVIVQSEGKDEAFIFVTLDSLKTLIARQIKYQHKQVRIEQAYLVVDVWKD
jgi:hypothetical protein